MYLANSPDWTGWSRVNDATVLAGVASAASAVGTSARLSVELPVRPGDVIEFTVWGRIVEGELVNNGALAIDNFTAVPGADLARRTVVTRLDSTDWRPYSLRYAVPVGAVADDYVRCSAGVFTNEAGRCEFRWPSISVERSQWGASRVLAMGLIACEAGVWSVAGSYRNMGIRTLEWASNTLTVGVDRVPVAIGTMPISQVTKTANGPADWRRLIPTVGSYASVDGSGLGSLQVRFVDPANGNFVDAVAALAGASGYINLTVEF